MDYTIYLRDGEYNLPLRWRIQVHSQVTNKIGGLTRRLSSGLLIGNFATGVILMPVHIFWKDPWCRTTVSGC